MFQLSRSANLWFGFDVAGLLQLACAQKVNLSNKADTVAHAGSVMARSQQMQHLSSVVRISVI